MNIPLIALGIVLLLIAVRRIGRVQIQIWQAMCLGAVAVVLSGSITMSAVWRAIDWDVMGFLSGAFIIGNALLRSGMLYQYAYAWLERVRTVDGLVIAVLISAALTSSILMNDTVAIIGTPLVLQLAREHRIDPRLLLLALAAAITIGSVPSPIGNPQNLLIASQGEFHNVFVEFASKLALPALLNLALAYVVLRVLFRGQFRQLVVQPALPKPTADSLAAWVKVSLAVFVAMVALKISFLQLGSGDQIRLSYIALTAAAPLLLFSADRYHLLKELDWRTLLFFAAMFILMASVWQTGTIQAWVQANDVAIATPSAVLLNSIVLSQVISNVPLVALYLPLLKDAAGQPELLLLLAAGSTIAGNLLVLGAASNIIIIQHAERHRATLTFLDFVRFGIPLTLLSVPIYWLAFA